MVQRDGAVVWRYCWRMLALVYQHSVDHNYRASGEAIGRRIASTDSHSGRSGEKVAEPYLIWQLRPPFPWLRLTARFKTFLFLLASSRARLI